MDTAEVLDLMKHAAREYIRPRFRALESDQIQEKNPGDLVTVADREAEEFLTRELLAGYPDATVLGEEATAFDPGLRSRAAAASHVFTIDPVDGTRNFVMGSPDYAVMVAEVREGRTVRSWIHQPERGHDYVAESGGGAWHNGARLPSPLLSTRAASSGDTAGTATAEAAAGVTARSSAVVHGAATNGSLRGATSDPSRFPHLPAGMPRPGLTWLSCGIDYPHLALGDLDYLVYLHTQPWDHLPGALLVAEVGGATSRLDGSTYGLDRSEPWILTTLRTGDLPTVRAALAGVLA